MRVRFLACVTLLFAVGLACGDGGTPRGVGPSQSGPIDFDAGAGGAGVGRLPCDVDAVLAKNCRECHAATPQYGAPMPLVTWSDLHARAPSDESRKVYELAAVKIASDTSPMPPSPMPRLGEADMKVLTDWAAAGAPRGPETCEGTPGDKSEPLVSCTPDMVLAPSEPWEMPAAAGDEYVCWGVDIAKSPARHITAFAPRIDNTKISHHIVMFEAPESFPSKPRRCSAAGSVLWRMVLGWAPGVGGLELPPEAGFPISTEGGDKATHYVVQMHYSNPQKLAGEKDASKIELCTSEPRKYEADVLAFGTQDIKIPAQPPVGGVFERACSITVPKELAGIHAFAAMPHMHKLGVSMKTVLAPAGGGPEVDLGTMSAFDFNTQAWLPIKATSSEGDVITTTCGWKNGTGVEVGFGENTADEMCYSFTMYYPRIQVPGGVWSWARPAATSKCK